MASYRAEILGLLPRRGAPPSLASFAEWKELMDRLVATGLVSDYTAIWWDARIHPKFGTLEIRSPDQPPTRRAHGGFRCALPGALRERLQAPPRPRLRFPRRLRPTAGRFALRAARDLHPPRRRRGRRGPSPAELLERIRPTRASSDRGLLEVDRARPLEGDRLLEVGRAEGLELACRDLVPSGPCDFRLSGQSSTETIQVSGIRCERCVMRLGAALAGARGASGRRTRT